MNNVIIKDVKLVSLKINLKDSTINKNLKPYVIKVNRKYEKKAIN